MDTFLVILFMVALVMLVVYIVKAIISSVKKNGQGKRNLKRAGISIGAILILFIIIGVTGDPVPQTAVVEKKQEEKVMTETEKAALKEKEEAASKKEAEEKKAKKEAEKKKAAEEKEAKEEAEKKKAAEEMKAKEEAKRKAEEEKKAKEEAAAKKAAEEKKAKEEATAKKAAEEKIAKEEAARKEAEKKAEAKAITYAQLKKNPDRYSGEYVKYTGEIIQILESDDFTNIRLSVTKESYGYNPNDLIFVEYVGLTDFVEGDVVTVYGTIYGKYTYTSQAGWDISLPGLLAEEIE